MDIIQTILLAILQGLTEFLPISSSAHLILVPKLLHWQDQGLLFDIAVHLGTLVAVVSYFYKDISVLLADFFSSIVQRQLVGQSKMAWGILFATIPVGLAGLLFKDFIEVEFRGGLVIAYSTIIFGILLGIADTINRKTKILRLELTWFDMAFIGVFQAIALIPGTSRSGITITAALLLGLSRQLGAKFAFLLSIPVIMLSGGSLGIDIIKSDITIDWLTLLLGFSISGITAYIVISLFMKLIQNISLTVFVVYRLVLGGVLLFLF